MSTGDVSAAYEAWTTRMSYALDSGYREEIRKFKKSVEDRKKGGTLQHSFFSAGFFHWFVYSIKCALNGAYPISILHEYQYQDDNGQVQIAKCNYIFLQQSGRLGWKLEGLYCILSLIFSIVILFTRFQQEMLSALRGGTGFGFITFRYMDTYAMEAKVARRLTGLDSTLKVLMIALLIITFVSLLFGRRFISYLVNIAVPVLLFMNPKEVYLQFASRFEFVETARKIILLVLVIAFMIWAIRSIFTGNWMTLIILIVCAVLFSNLKFFAYIGLIVYYFVNKGTHGVCFTYKKKSVLSKTTGQDTSNKRSRNSAESIVGGAIGTSIYGDTTDNSMYKSNDAKIRELQAKIRDLEGKISECEKKKQTEIQGRNNFGARPWGVENEVQRLEDEIRIYKNQINDYKKQIKNLK